MTITTWSCFQYHSNVVQQLKLPNRGLTPLMVKNKWNYVWIQFANEQILPVPPNGQVPIINLDHDTWEHDTWERTQCLGIRRGTSWSSHHMGKQNLKKDCSVWMCQLDHNRFRNPYWQNIKTFNKINFYWLFHFLSLHAIGGCKQVH